jgi:hypothetical protein
VISLGYNGFILWKKEVMKLMIEEWKNELEELEMKGISTRQGYLYRLEDEYENLGVVYEYLDRLSFDDNYTNTLKTQMMIWDIRNNILIVGDNLSTMMNQFIDNKITYQELSCRVYDLSTQLWLSLKCLDSMYENNEFDIKKEEYKDKLTTPLFCIFRIHKRLQTISIDFDEES